MDSVKNDTGVDGGLGRLLALTPLPRAEGLTLPKFCSGGRGKGHPAPRRDQGQEDPGCWSEEQPCTPEVD